MVPLGTTYRVIRVYQQIRWDSQMQNILLVGTWHPSHWHQGSKEVGHVYLGATYGVIYYMISRFIRTTRYRGTRPSTQTTGINDIKVYAMSLLEASLGHYRDKIKQRVL